MSSLFARRTMRLHHTVIVLSLIIAPNACKALQNKSPDGNPVHEHAHAKVTDPMASFARMVPGEWRVTFANGTKQFDTWHWGPGQHSMRGLTNGTNAAGDPWRALQVVYWHPGRKQVCLLNMHPDVPGIGRGVGEGTIKFDGEIADGVNDLYQTAGRRKMGLRWVFDGPDKYRATLLEDIGAGLEPLVEWDYARSLELTTTRPLAGDVSPKISKRLNVLEPLLSHTWEARGKWEGRSAKGERKEENEKNARDDRSATSHEAAGNERITEGSLHIQSNIEWVPYADYVFVRVKSPTIGGELVHLLDAYVFHHTGTNTTRCLALSNRGGVYEGDLTVLDGALQLELKGYEGARVVSHVVRFDFEKDGTVRQQTWSVSGDKRTLILDIHHKKLERKKD